MELKEEIGNTEKENDLRKEKCGTYELQLEDPKEKVKDDSENIDKAFSENKLKELKSVWKKEREEENISFAEVIKKQIQDKTKDTVIQIVKEKEEDLVRDTVARKKCMVIYGLQEKKNPNKYGREREERELVNKIIKKVQDDEQNLDREVEETHRIAKYGEGNIRPLKVRVRVRSQLAVEEITARATR